MFGKDSKKLASVILDSKGVEVNKEVNLNGEAMKSAITKLMKGLQTGDTNMASEGFKNAFKLCELEPHEEAEHED